MAFVLESYQPFHFIFVFYLMFLTLALTIEHQMVA